MPDIRSELLTENISFQEGTELIQRIMHEIRKVIVGKDIIVLKVLLAFLANGHVLLEDIPGVGKTTLALAFAKTLGLDYHRVQLTPDVLPSDITGFSMYHKESGVFEFHKGVAFCNLLLADEVNRTSPKTQSALLEVMEETAVTVDGVTYPMPKPYCVIATQNPVGSIGTQMLPESQMDRFMLCLQMGYPDLESEITILRNGGSAGSLQDVAQVVDPQKLIALQKLAAQIHVADEMLRYIVQLAEATRKHPMIRLGVSPRGSLAMIAVVKAVAIARGREYVIPDDVAVILQDVFAHRILLHPRAKMDHMTVGSVLDEILRDVPIPALRKA